jgi:protein phosphatase
MTITSAVATHSGLRREGNEDAYCVREDLGLYVVADGMGGHAAGEVASKLAVDTIEAVVHDTRGADVNSTWPFPYDMALSLNGNRLKAAIQMANRRVTSAMQDNDALRGMATTAAVILMHGQQGTLAHVGDSRAYRLRRGDLAPLTQDHSWVNDQVRSGLMTEDDARRHPWRNAVTRAISGGDDPEPDVAELELQAGDRYLICSDGLSGVVPPDQLINLLSLPGAPADACRALIDAANANGGPDNITVVVIDVA